MLKIFISKEIDLDSKELSVIAALNGLYSNKQDYLITSVSGIGYFISGSFLNKSVKRDRRIADNIKGALQSLNDRRSIKLRYNAFCNGAKRYQNNPAAIMQLLEECRKYNKSLDYKPIETLDSDGKFKEADILDLSVFDNIIQDFVESADEWGKVDPLTYKNNIEKFVNQTACEKSVG